MAHPWSNIHHKVPDVKECLRLLNRGRSTVLYMKSGERVAGAFVNYEGGLVELDGCDPVDVSDIADVAIQIATEPPE